MSRWVKLIKAYNEEDSKYGVFQYLNDSDEIIQTFYCDTFEEAKDLAKTIEDDTPNSYTEVWKKGRGGEWHSGTLLYKSDK